jgi:hypothetical protein
MWPSQPQSAAHSEEMEPARVRLKEGSYVPRRGPCPASGLTLTFELE